MANDVTNIIITEADLSKYSSKRKQFDFNKIIPIPDELDIACGSLSSYILIYRDATIETEHLIEKIKKSNHKEIENFCQAIINLNETGYACWYDWSVEKWGTKWPSRDFRKISGHVTFNTAWSSPEPIFKELSRIEKGKEIKIISVEEDDLIIFLDVFRDGEVIDHKIIGRMEWCCDKELYHFEDVSNNDKDKILEIVLKRV